MSLPEGLCRNVASIMEQGRPFLNAKIYYGTPFIVRGVNAVIDKYFFVM